MKIKKFYESIKLKNKEDSNTLNKIDSCIEDIIDFLKDNNINNWEEFMNASGFERWTVNTIIDSNCENKEDLDEVRFKVKLRLSNLEQLKDMLTEYEDLEEYEKCSEVQKQMQNLS